MKIITEKEANIIMTIGYDNTNENEMWPHGYLPKVTPICALHGIENTLILFNFWPEQAL